MGKDSCCQSNYENQVLANLGKLVLGQLNQNQGSFEYPICNNGVQLFVRCCYNACGITQVAYFDIQRNPADPPTNWDLVSVGPCGVNNPLYGIATLSYVDTATGSPTGSITAGAESVVIKNVGDADGLVQGKQLKVGENFGPVLAFLDPVTGQFKRLPVITYDATNTQFHITVLS